MSNNYNSTLQSNNADLQTVLQTLQTKAAGGTQATPIISVSSNGLITATAGTKTSTHQLAFQAAKTITPSTANQIAVSSGYYTGGNITVAAVPTQTKTVTPKATTQNIAPDSGKFLSKVTVNGDSNLVAGNIKSGVSIFGVNGTYAGTSTIDSVSVYIQPSWSGTLQYIDENCQFQSLSLNSGELKLIKCIKNAPAVFSGYKAVPTSSSDFIMEDANGNVVFVTHFTSNTMYMI